MTIWERIGGGEKDCIFRQEKEGISITDYCGLRILGRI